MTKVKTYNTIEDIEAHCDELREELHKSSEAMGSLWVKLTTTHKPTTRGELVTNIISKGITAFDAFMLARKLVLQYRHLFTRGKRR